MKKTIQTIILALLTAVIISCGGSSDEITQGNEGYIPEKNTEYTTVTYDEIRELRIEIQKYKDMYYGVGHPYGVEYKNKYVEAQVMLSSDENNFKQEYKNVSEYEKWIIKNNYQKILKELEEKLNKVPDDYKGEARPDLYPNKWE